jgi:putative membrane protein
MMWNGGMSWFGWIFMTAFWVLVIAGVVWLVHAAGRPSADGGGSARRILDERFANGELSVEEYEQRRRALR